MIKIERDNAYGADRGRLGICLLVVTEWLAEKGCRARNFPSRGFWKIVRPGPSLQQQDRRLGRCCSRCQSRCLPETGSRRLSASHIRERTVSIVSPHHTCAAAYTGRSGTLQFRPSRKIQIPVVVVINERSRPRFMPLLHPAAAWSYVFETCRSSHCAARESANRSSTQGQVKPSLS